MIFLQILVILLFGIIIMLPVYVNLFKDSMYIEFEKMLKKEEEIKIKNKSNKRR